MLLICLCGAATLNTHAGWMHETQMKLIKTPFPCTGLERQSFVVGYFFVQFCTMSIAYCFFLFPRSCWNLRRSWRIHFRKRRRNVPIGIKTEKILQTHRRSTTKNVFNVTRLNTMIRGKNIKENLFSAQSLSMSNRGKKNYCRVINLFLSGNKLPCTLYGNVLNFGPFFV